MTSVKSRISSDHLATLMAEHGGKLYPQQRKIYMTGDERPGSIGETIRMQLMNYPDVDITSCPFDLTVYGALERGEGNKLKDFTDLIMCHGKMHLDWFEEAPLGELIDVVAVNLIGTIQMVQTFVQATIRNQHRKTIIGIGSMAYKAVLNGSAAYCASKAGMAHLMKCLAWELAPKGYDVYCIHPSNTLDTPMSEATILGLMRYRNMTREEAEAYWNDSTIRSESLTKNEIADLVEHLLLNRNPYLSGCNLELGGGQR